jgi:hypothetical protein
LITHSGLFHSHLVTKTPTISQAVASILNLPGTKMSFLINGLCGNTKPKLLFFQGTYSQTIKSVFLSIIFITSASSLQLKVLTLALTLSQSKAHFLLFENTKNHFSIHSTSINQKSHFH